MRKERERGQNHKKGRNDCHILDKNDSLHVFYAQKEHSPPEYFPDATRKEYNPISKGYTLYPVWCHPLCNIATPFGA